MLKSKILNAVSIIICFSILFYSKVGHVTRTSYDTLSIENLIARSHCIFIGRKSKPFQTTSPISILPTNSQYEGKNQPPYYEPPYHDSSPGPHLDKNYPPYQQTQFHFEIDYVFTFLVIFFW